MGKKNLRPDSARFQRSVTHLFSVRVDYYRYVLAVISALSKKKFDFSVSCYVSCGFLESLPRNHLAIGITDALEMQRLEHFRMFCVVNLLTS